MQYQLCMPGVKYQTVKQTYDNFMCYSGIALAELVSSVPRRSWNDSDYSAFRFSVLSRMNASRLEQCDICCDISQQVHNTNLKHIKQGHPLGHPASIFGKYLFGKYLTSRIFGTFVVKFLACLPLLGFSNI